MLAVLTASYAGDIATPDLKPNSSRRVVAAPATSSLPVRLCCPMLGQALLLACLHAATFQMTCGTRSNKPAAPTSTPKQRHYRLAVGCTTWNTPKARCRKRGLLHLQEKYNTHAARNEGCCTWKQNKKHAACDEGCCTFKPTHTQLATRAAAPARQHNTHAARNEGCCTCKKIQHTRSPK